MENAGSIGIFVYYALCLLVTVLYIVGIVKLVKWIKRGIKRKAAEEEAARVAYYQEQERKKAEEIARKKAEEEQKKAEKKRKEEEAKRLVEQWTSTYQKSPYVQKLAQALAYEFIYTIQNITYDIHKKEVSVYVERNAYYEVDQTYSERMFVANDLRIDGFDFYKENVSQYEFKNEFQIQGFMKAVAIVAKEIVTKEYVAKHPVDVNGQKYKIWAGGGYPYGQWSDPDHQYDENDRKEGYGWWNYECSVNLGYSAPNPYYQAPKSLI